MSTLIERFEHGGMTVELHYEETPSNPLTDWDLLPGTLYNWGQHDNDLCIGGVERVDADDFTVEVYDDDELTGWRERTVVEYFDDENTEPVVVVPLAFWGSNHGSGTASLDAAPNDPDNANCAWVMTVDEAVSEFGDIEQAKAAVLAGCETIVDYCNGHVYGYVIRDAAGHEVESLWDIYGFQFAIDDAKQRAEQLGAVAAIHAQCWSHEMSAAAIA